MFSSCRTEIALPIKASFEYNVIDNNFNIPVSIEFTNNSTGGLFYRWSFEQDSVLFFSTEKNPGTFVFNQSGLLKVRLVVRNDFDSAVVEKSINLDDPPMAAFEIDSVVNRIAPAQFYFRNTSRSASTFLWVYPNGQVDTSSNPGLYTLNDPGFYSVKLIAINSRGRVDSVEKIIQVFPPLQLDVSLSPSFFDDDFEAPFEVDIRNNSSQVEHHSWKILGPQSFTLSGKNPKISLQSPGEYLIRYIADNRKQKDSLSFSFSIKPNSGLRTFEDVRFGINTSTVHSAFSTIQRKSYGREEFSGENSFIDLVFFGLNEGFTFCRFINPQEASLWSFPSIFNAQKTSIINVVEQVKNDLEVTVNPQWFHSIKVGDQLNVFSEIVSSDHFFTGLQGERVVLFKNARGKKGAILIKRFVNNGLNSYIVCDIKVQKD